MYFEFYTLGGSVKVVAIDAASGVEVSIIGDPAMPPGVLRTVALKKLVYAIDRKTRVKS